MAVRTIQISKSKFVAVYLQVHQPELAAESDDGQEARFEEGQEVGILARPAF